MCRSRKPILPGIVELWNCGIVPQFPQGDSWRRQEMSHLSSKASQRRHIPTYDKALLLHPPGGRAPRLPISEHAIHEVLIAQPGMQMLAAELSMLFSARTEAERQQLTLAISRVADLISSTPGPVVRLRVAGASGIRRRATAQEAADSADKRTISADAVHALLRREPQQTMELSKLRACFDPRSKAERQALVVAIMEVADLLSEPGVEAAPGEQLARRFARLKPSLMHAGDLEAATDGASTSEGLGPAPAEASEEALPVTSMERELVRTLLLGAPGGSMRSDEIARMLSADSEQARRRLALVVSQVARAVQRREGSRLATHFVLREEGGQASGQAGGQAVGQARKWVDSWAVGKRAAWGADRWFLDCYAFASLRSSYNFLMLSI